MAMPALGEDADKQFLDLPKSAGRVGSNDILEVAQSVMASIEGAPASLSQHLHIDIEALAEYIHSAKAGITEIRADKINTEYPPAASDPLRAIAGATEKATASQSGACPDKDLVNGPCLPGAGNGQDDVDGLLAGFD